jgi:excisionase family DNA binding protein
MSVNDIGPLAFQLPEHFVATIAERVAEIVLDRFEQISDRRWLSVDRAAEYIDRTPDAIRGLVKRGQLTAYKPDGRLQLDREELDRWMRGAQ